MDIPPIFFLMNDTSHIKRQITWLITLRVVIISTLLGAAMLIQFIRGEAFLELVPIYYLVGAVYFLTIVYIAVFSYFKKGFEIFVFGQFAGDLLFITLLILFSGGILSPFHVLYILSIVSASTILFRRGAMIVASGSFILYGLLVNLLYHDIVRLPDSFIFEKQVKTADVYYNLFVSFIGFYVVAYLSSLITEKLRQTDRSLKEASGNLEELLLFHENIITSITTGLITTNMDNSITSLNRAAEELLGLSFSEVNGRDILDLFPPGGRINKSFRAGGQGFGVESYFEIEVPQGKDNHKYLGVTVSDFYDRQDRLLGHIYLFQDLTEVKKLEHEIKIKERMATVGEMAATIAHEIRNPLASMSGCIQMLRGQTTSGSQDEALMNIFIRESDRLNRIIEDFLIYARPSPTIPSWISLDQLLQDTCTLLQHSSELHENHEVKLNIDGQSHFQYYADPDQMKQVFWNLARNALQAMPQGGVLEISLRKDSSGRLILVFRDEGTGIEDEQVHKIFQPFHARYKEGAGLGLAIVYRIIHEHKGDIYVSSAPKAGTTLTIILPPVSEN